MLPEGDLQVPIIERLRSNGQFKELAKPIDSGLFPLVRDAEFYIRHDGVIVNAEGWHHPADKLVGEVLYVPDSLGNRVIFGQSYSKVSLYPGTYTPVPYHMRPEVLGRYDSALDQRGENPYFARYKQILPRSEFCAYLSARDVYEKIMHGSQYPTDVLAENILNGQDLLHVDFEEFRIGLTGAPLLGNTQNIHDIDIVFQGNVEQNMQLAKRIRDMVRDRPERRVIEGGKGWNIRYYNDLGSLMCNFFTYQNPEDAPPRGFEMELIADNVEANAVVSSDLHSIYTPSVWGVSDVRLTQIGEEKVDLSLDREIKLVAYHTATRGECFEGDELNLKGALVNIIGDKGSEIALCVIDEKEYAIILQLGEIFTND